MRKGDAVLMWQIGLAHRLSLVATKLFAKLILKIIF